MLKRLLAVVLFLTASTSTAEDLDDLVARVMRTYGGAAAWAKVTSFRETGTVISPTRTGKLTREWQRPGKLRVEIVYPTNTELRIVDGDKGTQNGKEATGMGLDAMRLQAARLALPFLLSEKRAALRDLGVQEKVRQVEIPISRSMTLSIDIDPETGHIVRSNR